MNDSGSHAPEEVSVTPAVTARSGSDRRGRREGRVVWQALPLCCIIAPMLEWEGAPGLCSPLQSILLHRR